MSAPDPAGPARVLVVEDSPTQAELARVMMAGLGHDVRLADTGARALALVRAWEPDAILLDLGLPDVSGFDLMRQLRAEQFDPVIVVVTANGSINAAVEAIREGAVDFLVKPFTKARLSVTLGNSLERRRLSAQLRSVRARLDRDRFHGFIGASPAMLSVYRTIESVAPSTASVFITGESGTGKELAADAIHRASPRAGRPFVALNCGAIPRDLLESEIFGHVKGAFSGATGDRVGAAKQADTGTLFLDEIGELPLDMQVKLLRFTQTSSFQPVGASRLERVDVRFVCATNRDPLDEVASGRFREDLFYRLYVVPLMLPALRERGGDIVLIARHLLERFSREEGRAFRGFTPEAEHALLAYPWPGNVRQLQNVVRNIVVLHDGEHVTADMLPRQMLRLPGATVVMPPREADALPETMAAPQPAPQTVPLPPAPPPANDDAAPAGRSADPAAEMEIVPLAVMERRLIEAALARTGNDVPRAAGLLRINPSTIYRKLQTWRTQDGAGD
jgi:two-component system repressor protein LuxO